MSNQILLFSLALLCLGLSSALLVIIRMYRKRTAAYKSALEISQKRVDQQTSRINMIVRELPNLQNVITSSNTHDNWQALVLDQARTLIWADGASYWTYSALVNELNLVVARGCENPPKEQKITIQKDNNGDLAQAAQNRIPVLVINEKDVLSTESVLAVPHIVSGEVTGIFRFVRNGHDVLTTRDSDVVFLFMKQLSLAIENRAMVNNREKFYLELVQTLADILDSRDAANEGQTRRARALSRAMAMELDLPNEFIYYLEFAALMHDIGKIAIDESLLKKPGKLTPQEFETIKKHPELGYKILAPVSMLAPVAPMVLYHQEWFNGKGYPEGLHGEEIPLGARIVAIIDAWGAMTSHRPWRPALTKEEAVKEIKKGAGTQFDPRVVEAFLLAIEKQGVASENTQ